MSTTAHPSNPAPDRPGIRASAPQHAHEPSEPIACESSGHGQHAYVSLTGMTLSEAIRFADSAVARASSIGDNVSPSMTLAHAGHVAMMLVDDVDAVTVVSK